MCCEWSEVGASAKTPVRPVTWINFVFSDKGEVSEPHLFPHLSKWTVTLPNWNLDLAAALYRVISELPNAGKPGPQVQIAALPWVCVRHVLEWGGINMGVSWKLSQNQELHLKAKWHALYFLVVNTGIYNWKPGLSCWSTYRNSHLLTQEYK